MPRGWIVLMVVLFPALLALPQAAHPDLHFNNVSSCPLVAKLRAGDDKLLVTNRSNARVVAFRWGCVAETGGRFKLVKTLRTEQQRFDAPRGAEADSWGDFVSGYQYDSQQCSAVAATLAITQVRFEDGGEWRLQ